VSIDRVSVVRAYVETRMAHAFLRRRPDIERHQRKLWRRLAPAIANTPALSSFVGAPLSALPIVEPPEMRARPGEWNSLGLGAETLAAGAEAAEHGGSGEVRPGVFAGFSTGSSGIRGVFLSSEAERARYLGQSLAKLLPDPPLRRRRIGLCLRANNALYRDVAKTGPFEFRYFSLATPARERSREIEAFAPDIFIAPSHVLAELARLAASKEFLPPRFERLFYGAEPMGAAERAWITQTLGARPDPIYQATEGFLGASCERGALHLNEDSIAFEFEPVAGSDRHRPIVTDLRRTSQPIVRVRLDDIVQFLDAPCSCGSLLRAIHPIEGRVTDVWRWGETRIFPRQVEDAVARTAPPSSEWRAIASPGGVRLACDTAHAQQVQSGLAALLDEAGVVQTISRVPLEPQNAVKQRRVQWADD
jgi:putative adenylate-forming enzyme